MGNVLVRISSGFQSKFSFYLYLSLFLGKKGSAFLAKSCLYSLLDHYNSIDNLLWNRCCGRLVQKRWAIRVLIEKRNNLIEKRNSLLTKNSFFKKARGWLYSQKHWVILLLFFIPQVHLITGLGSSLIGAEKLFNKRIGIFILLLGNIFSWWYLADKAYQALHLPW